jgi:hypothetical protein
MAGRDYFPLPTELYFTVTLISYPLWGSLKYLHVTGDGWGATVAGLLGIALWVAYLGLCLLFRKSLAPADETSTPGLQRASQNAVLLFTVAPVVLVEAWTW